MEGKMSEEVSNAFEDIGRAIHFTSKKRFITASLILTYSAIDAMASLIMPEKQKNVTGKDFKKWVNKYMKTDSNQPYQYRGIGL